MPCNLRGQFVFNSDNNDVLTFCPKKRAFSESTEIPAPGPDLSAPFFAAGWTKKGNINWKNWIISWQQRWSTKLSNFNSQWTKTLYQNNLKDIENSFVNHLSVKLISSIKIIIIIIIIIIIPFYILQGLKM